MAVKTGNVAVSSDCQHILCLNDFNVVGNSRTESIARLFQRLAGEGYRAFLDGDFLCSRLQDPDKRREPPDRSWLASLPVAVFPLLAKRRPGECPRVLFHPENRNAERGSRIDGAVRRARVNSRETVVGFYA